MNERSCRWSTKYCRKDCRRRWMNLEEFLKTSRGRFTKNVQSSSSADTTFIEEQLKENQRDSDRKSNEIKEGNVKDRKMCGRQRIRDERKKIRCARKRSLMKRVRKRVRKEKSCWGETLFLRLQEKEFSWREEDLLPILYHKNLSRSLTRLLADSCGVSFHPRELEFFFSLFFPLLPLLLTLLKLKGVETEREILVIRGEEKLLQ